MEEKILIINTGSSSIKFKVFNKNKKELAQGICERILVDGFFKIKYFIEKKEDEKKEDEKKEEKEILFETKESFSNHKIAIDFLLLKLVELKIVSELNEIVSIGHRIVHGGNYFTSSVLLDYNNEEKIEELVSLAPLHNKIQLNVIRILKEKLPGVKQIASFDTSFHFTIPDINSTYALPESWRKDYGIKKYGAHGISYRYITKRVKEIFKKDNVNIIVCHLGNGASVCAIKNNNSINTSMGLTPLSGLVMSTRCGDIDPSIHEYISKSSGLSLQEINNKLINESGLKALCGYSDFRDITKKALNENSYELTMNLFCKKVSDYIAMYINEMENKVDAIIFTGGIGENNKDVRKRIIKNIFISNFKISRMLNRKKNKDSLKISSFFSKKVYVIKTNEEEIILEDVLNLI